MSRLKTSNSSWMRTSYTVTMFWAVLHDSAIVDGQITKNRFKPHEKEECLFWGFWSFRGVLPKKCACHSNNPLVNSNLASLIPRSPIYFWMKWLWHVIFHAYIGNQIRSFITVITAHSHWGHLNANTSSPYTSVSRTTLLLILMLSNIYPHPLYIYGFLFLGGGV